MELSFEEMLVTLIVKDPELIKLLKSKVKEALLKVDLAEVIGRNLAETIDNSFEDLDLSQTITKPITEAISKFLENTFCNAKN